MDTFLPQGGDELVQLISVSCHPGHLEGMAQRWARDPVSDLCVEKLLFSPDCGV